MPPEVANLTVTLRSSWPQDWQVVPQALHVKPHEVFKESAVCKLLSPPISSRYSTRAFILRFPPLPSPTPLVHSCSSRGAVADAREL